MGELEDAAAPIVSNVGQFKMSDVGLTVQDIDVRSSFYALQIFLCIL